MKKAYLKLLEIFECLLEEKQGRFLCERKFLDVMVLEYCGMDEYTLLLENILLRTSTHLTSRISRIQKM